MYTNDEILMISGIQHFYFCKRQWALIHMEQQWAENVHTAKGQILHEKVDDPFIFESRNDYFISRSLPLISYNLGFYGIADAVEFRLDNSGCFIPSKNNFYKVIPVEYKVGKPKEDNRDAIQLCVQAMCLEEMFQTSIRTGYLYYGKTRHRHLIEIDELLRQEVRQLSKEMHEILEKDRKILPIYSAKCVNCSLYNVCVPKTKKAYKSVKRYIDIKLTEKD